ncbi:hypothetical protein ACA910_006007 [Epithemia clementina (nom. ined.)]
MRSSCKRNTKLRSGVHNALDLLRHNLHSGLLLIVCLFLCHYAQALLDPARSEAGKVATSEMRRKSKRGRKRKRGSVGFPEVSHVSCSRLGAACTRLVGGSQQQQHQKKSPKPPVFENRTKSSALLDGLRSGAASGMAAACSKTLLQPLDAIKTLQQYQKTGQAQQRALSTLEAAQTLIRRPGGIANFYAGLGVAVVGSIPGVALYFGLYQFFKEKFSQTEWGAEHRTVSIALAAAIGNTVASAARTPYEVLKQKLQMGTYSSFGAAARAVLAHPVDSLFPKGGVLIQIARDVPYAVVTLLVYETLQEAFRSRILSDEKKKKWDFMIGGFAGGVGSWVTNPMDVLKTRLQTDSANVYGGSILQCAGMVWKEGGAPAFLRGSVPRLMHKVPANCFFFLFYEMFRRVLNAPQPDRPKDTKSKR